MQSPPAHVQTNSVQRATNEHMWALGGLRPLYRRIADFAARSAADRWPGYFDRPLRKTKLVEQLEESRIAAERFPSRVHPEGGQFKASVLKRLGQPLKSVVCLSQRKVDRSQLER